MYIITDEEVIQKEIDGRGKGTAKEGRRRRRESRKTQQKLRPLFPFLLASLPSPPFSIIHPLSQLFPMGPQGQKFLDLPENYKDDSSVNLIEDYVMNFSFQEKDSYFLTFGQISSSGQSINHILLGKVRANRDQTPCFKRHNPGMLIYPRKLQPNQLHGPGLCCHCSLELSASENGVQSTG